MCWGVHTFGRYKAFHMWLAGPTLDKCWIWVYCHLVPSQSGSLWIFGCITRLEHSLHISLTLDRVSIGEGILLSCFTLLQHEPRHGYPVWMFISHWLLFLLILWDICHSNNLIMQSIIWFFYVIVIAIEDFR